MKPIYYVKLHGGFTVPNIRNFLLVHSINWGRIRSLLRNFSIRNGCIVLGRNKYKQTRDGFGQLENSKEAASSMKMASGCR